MSLGSRTTRVLSRRRSDRTRGAGAGGVPCACRPTSGLTRRCRTTARPRSTTSAVTTWRRILARAATSRPRIRPPTPSRASRSEHAACATIRPQAGPLAPNATPLAPVTASSAGTWTRPCSTPTRWPRRRCTPSTTVPTTRTLAARASLSSVPRQRSGPTRSRNWCGLDLSDSGRSMATATTPRATTWAARRQTLTGWAGSVRPNPSGLLPSPLPLTGDAAAPSQPCVPFRWK